MRQDPRTAELHTVSELVAIFGLTHVRLSAWLGAVQGTERLLTSAEVAVKLGISKRTVHRRAELGRIPFVRKLHEPNGAYLFDPSVIEYLAREQQREAS